MVAPKSVDQIPDNNGALGTYHPLFDHIHGGTSPLKYCALFQKDPV